MGKLALVIADIDESYLKRLGNYIMLHHSSKFDLYSFTSAELLASFLQNNAAQADILLCGSSFPEELLNNDKIHTAIKLVDNCKSDSTGNVESIFKYMHTEKLIKDILSCYSKKSNTNFLPDGKKSTILAAVHSSSGGAGKTSIAAGLSMMSSRRGLKTFYLNLESIPSTYFYFKGLSDRTFSDIIYYLKDKGGNHALKLESACCIDPASGVHYLLPPESITELEELSLEDIDLLLKTLRMSSQFDLVFIDLPSDISLRNLFIMKNSDMIIKICTQGKLSGCRDEVIEKEMGIAGNGKPDDYTAVWPVLNKYNEAVGFHSNNNIAKYSFRAIINESDSLKYYCGDKPLIEVDTAFTASLGKLLESLISEGGEDKGRSGGRINA